jgi:hypothetical protein
MKVSSRPLLRLVIFALVGLAPAVPSAAAAQPAVSLILNAPKTMLKIGADLKVEVTMTNISDHDVSYRANLAGGSLPFEIVVHDATGNKVPRTPKGLSVLGNDGSAILIRIHPGETIHRDLLLNEDFDLNRPGKYTVQAMRRVGHVMAESNVVVATIVP